MLDKLKFTASPDYVTAVTTLVAMFWTFDINKVSKELTRTITFLAGHVCKLKAFKTTPALQKNSELLFFLILLIVLASSSGNLTS